MAIGFRFMLVTTDDELVDPGVFLCAEPRRSVGDVVTLGRDRRYRMKGAITRVAAHAAAVGSHELSRG